MDMLTTLVSVKASLITIVAIFITKLDSNIMAVSSRYYGICSSSQSTRTSTYQKPEAK